MLPGISVERAPPLTVPLRFLLTAPWFACLAGLLLLWAGPSVFASRWEPATLALTHLLTLGLMGHAMLGALLQLLPVVAGTPIPHSRLVAAVAYPALLLGTLLLAAGFLFARPWPFRVAVVALGTGIAVYVLAAAWGFLRSRPRDASSRTLALALLGLSVTAGLGAALASAFGWSLSLPLMTLTDLHAAWGLIGWTLLLVLGASLVLVPMFHVTPSFPAWARRGLGAGVLLGLLAWSIARVYQLGGVTTALEGIVAAQVAAVALSVLVLQQQGRRRNQPDVTFLFWRTSMLCLLAAVALWGAGLYWGWRQRDAYVLVMGALLIPGFAMCAILGMLYRIVPFLLWLYLQLRISGRPPNVKRILPDEWAMPQLWLHRATLVLLLLAAGGVQWLARPSGALFAVSSALLGVNLLRASLFAGRVLRSSPPLPQGQGRSRWKSLS